MVSEDLMLMPNLVPQCEALKPYRADLHLHIEKKKKYQTHCALLFWMLSETTWVIRALIAEKSNELRLAIHNRWM